MSSSYELIDSGNQRKFERFGRYKIVRPASQAIWRPNLSEREWQKTDGIFTREDVCQWLKEIEGDWIVDVAGIRFKLSPTDFGHLGIFPEQKKVWVWIQSLIKQIAKIRKNPIRILNLFAYSGGATIAAASAGAEVCHLDSSKGMVAWARENAELNGCSDNPIRWIVDDVKKFLARELKRAQQYDGIIVDPPSFGRGNRGEVFKIERDLPHLLEQCRKLLSDQPLFLMLSCHTPSISPMILRNLLSQTLQGFSGTIEQGELLLEGGVFPLPSGTFARWQNG
ncbi:MAG TPA: class I SAM-dependent methyltransferase [Waddliaceae bacterium]